MLTDTRSTTEFLCNLIQKKDSRGKIPGVTLFHSSLEYQLIDWKLNGCFSRLERAGVVTGTYGQKTLAPVLWNGHALSFTIIGMGTLKEPDEHLKGIACGH